MSLEITESTQFVTDPGSSLPMPRTKSFTQQ